ncbi:hypothetical protein QBC40DRAFT_45061 [Triangularia verruculosa]|uniref:Secreted protein n=1 Tax=Triangularia verruculosa TaxID=2587418 RepID=A0AAN7AYU2_9PEZI|nr:hypothetical protein QBC40DRAFT_45061 [Triangularia verruculosa]
MSLAFPSICLFCVHSPIVLAIKIMEYHFLSLVLECDQKPRGINQERKGNINYYKRPKNQTNICPSSIPIHPSRTIPDKSRSTM